MMKHSLLLLCSFIASFLLLHPAPAEACTAAVVSGKATPDGRPLLWKHRDTDFRENNMRYFRGERYSFIAIVNSVEQHPDEVWIGTNSAGFAIMNTQTYNLVDVKPGEERGEANGRILRRALEICATVDDFRHFLDTLAKPSGIEANIGVIDAQGGAALFEVDYTRYTLFDANNPVDAPEGYILRTNYSFTGKKDTGGGYVRFMQADKLMLPMAQAHAVTPARIFGDLSRCFAHPLLGIDLKSGDYNRPKTNGWFIDQDFIPRRSTASSVVIQGVKPGEKPELTTAWTILGYPPTGIAMPVWLKGAEQALPALIGYDTRLHTAPLAHRSLQLADKVFSYRQGMGSERYFEWERLYTPRHTGYMQLLEPAENDVFYIANPILDQWRKQGYISEKEMEKLYDKLTDVIDRAYDRIN
ncbi:MAG: C45 family peptidase [Prevotellaceae bacterium]|nr:C45 family peptidase [Prevotellaceae bacterium]